MPDYAFSAYAECQASAAVAAGAFSAGTLTPIVTALGATESKRLQLDFRLNITSGTPTENANINLFRRRGDGTNQAPAPAGAYQEEFVGSFILDNAAGFYYLDAVLNADPNDEYYWYNDDPTVTLTASLDVRSRNAVASA